MDKKQKATDRRIAPKQKHLLFKAVKIWRIGKRGEILNSKIGRKKQT